MRGLDDLGLAKLFRAESGRILSILLLQTRDISLAEDALQDAFFQASVAWKNQQKPNNEIAWLLTVAKRRLVDRIRKESHRNKESTLQDITDLHQPIENKEGEGNYPDERLRLIFTCCHPSLANNVRVPLTLKTLCGLSTREVARAYLVSEHAMEQRLTRAKRKIRDAGIAYKVPFGDALKSRLESVLKVLYLFYNESYSVFEGQCLTREDFANEAINLTRLLQMMMPNPEVEGLLALMLLHDSRRLTRSSSAQEFIPLEHQDRSKWNQKKIKEGVALSLSSLAQGQPGKYQIQAAISSLHSLAPNWQATDWAQIQQLYEVLLTVEPSPVIELNLAMAIAYGGNISKALEKINPLERSLSNYQPFYVARAELFKQLNNAEKAIENLEHSLTLTANDMEREYLLAKLSSLSK